MKTYLLFLILLAVGTVFAQPPPPPPPPPPQFMVMKGLPLACFEKPTFEDDGLEFFVCNGGGGLAGVRKKADPAHTVLVRDPDIANNLNMQAAKIACAKGKLSVQADSSGIVSFLCQDKEMEIKARFVIASKADWQKYVKYLNK